jgi:hypothetical protein
MNLVCYPRNVGVSKEREQVRRPPRAKPVV